MACCYRVAGLVVASAAPIPTLGPFALASTGYMVMPAASETSCRGRQETILFDGQVELGGTTVRLECGRGSSGWALALDGLAALDVSADGSFISVRREGQDAPLLGEALLGPALVLALAARGIFCLHASAVRLGDDVVAFAGESGSGKSTLARELARPGAGNWERIADDVVPVALDREGVVALPHFPQLKLPSADQYPVSRRARLRLRALVVLAPRPATEQVAYHTVSPSEALLAVAAHTVAARLFDPTLLATHLELCGEVASRVPVCELAYPRSMLVFDAISEAISGELDARESG